MKVNAQNDKRNPESCVIICLVKGNPWLKVYLQSRSDGGQWTKYSDKLLIASEQKEETFLWKFQIESIEQLQSADEYRCVAQNTNFYVYSQPLKLENIYCYSERNRGEM